MFGDEDEILRVKYCIYYFVAGISYSNFACA